MNEQNPPTTTAGQETHSAGDENAQPQGRDAAVWHQFAEWPRWADKTAMRAHIAALGVANAKTAQRLISEHVCGEGNIEAARTALTKHLPVVRAAFVACALMSDWTAENAYSAIGENPDLVEECLSGWADGWDEIAAADDSAAEEPRTYGEKAGVPA